MSTGGSDANITVAAEAAGTEAVEQDIQQVEERVESAGDEMEDTSDKMGGLSRKMKGLGKTLVAGMAIAAAGLLSQVPVIGEAMSGLGAVVQALAFQIDKRLRGEITGLTQELFDLSAAIFEGDWEQAEKELGDLASKLASIDFEGGFEGLIEFRNELIDKLATAFGDFVDNLTPEDVQQAVAKLIDMFTLQWGSLVEATDWSALLLDILEFLGIAALGLGMAIKSEIVDPILASIEQGIEDKASDATQWLDGVMNELSSWATGLVEDATQWGKDMIDGFIEGIEEKVSDVGGAVAGAAEEARRYMPGSDAETGPLSDLSQTGPAFVDTVASGIEANTGRLGGAAEGAAGGMDTAGFLADRGQDTLRVSMDGRDLSESTGRYRSDPSRRRGL